MPLGNFLLLIAALWTAFLLSGCSAPVKQSEKSPSVENWMPQDSLSSPGPMPSGWADIKPGMTKDQVRSLLGEPSFFHEAGILDLWDKREGDIVWNMRVRYRPPGLVRVAVPTPAPALLTDQYRPADQKLTLPPSVIDQTKRQIQFYLGDIPSKGIPLLDPSIHWTDIRHWPDQLEFGGERLEMGVSENDFDTFRMIRLKTELRRGYGATLGYRKASEPGSGYPNLGPSSYWSRNGTIREQVFNWKEKRVFLYAFYPNGTLRTFSWDDPASGQYHSNYFDRSGCLVATSRGDTYRWRGKPVTVDKFHQRLDRL